MTNLIKKKTICFLIFGVGKANGGHYRSLRVISESLSTDYNILIINIGFTYSNIIKTSFLQTHFVYFNGFNFWKTVKEIKKILKGLKADYIHAFDYQSFFIARIISKHYKIPRFSTKCGGPSPKGYYPYSYFRTVFSDEDYDFFSNDIRFRGSILKLIPNRINEFPSNSTKMDKLKQSYPLNDKIVFLRICRICQFYLKSIEQSINLVMELSKIRQDVVLLIVGNIQDEEVYKIIKHRIKELKNIFIISNDEITKDAKEIIDIADCVIGTGRGFMEAASKSKVMLTPSKESSYPILIDDNNFKTAFDKNFSERIVFDKSIISDNLNNISTLLESNFLFEKSKKDSYKWFENHFSINEAKPQYISLYESAYYIKDNKKDLFLHWIFVIRNNVGTWLRIIESNFK